MGKGRNPAALILTEKITALVVCLSTRFLDLNSTLTAKGPNLERSQILSNHGKSPIPIRKKKKTYKGGLGGTLNVSLELNYRLKAHAVNPFFCFVLFYCEKSSFHETRLPETGWKTSLIYNAQRWHRPPLTDHRQPEHLLLLPTDLLIELPLKCEKSPLLFPLMPFTPVASRRQLNRCEHVPLPSETDNKCVKSPFSYPTHELHSDLGPSALCRLLGAPRPSLRQPSDGIGVGATEPVAVYALSRERSKVSRYWRVQSAPLAHAYKTRASKTVSCDLQAVKLSRLHLSSIRVKTAPVFGWGSKKRAVS